MNLSDESDPSELKQGAEVSLQDLAVGYGPAFKRACPSPAFVPRLRIGGEGKCKENGVGPRAFSPNLPNNAHTSMSK